MINLNFITGLRGILCIWVVLFHFTHRYSELYGQEFFLHYKSGGRVCMFFILSGYFTLLTLKKFYRDGAFEWIKNKIFRLYPAYAIACVTVFLFLTFFPLKGRGDLTLTDLLKDLLMVPFVSGKIEGAHWYVLSLVKFYLAFYFVAKYRLQDSLLFYIMVMLLTAISAILNRYAVEWSGTEIISIGLFSFLNIQIYAGLLLFKALEQPKKFLWLMVMFTIFLALKVHIISIPLMVLFLFFSLRSNDALLRIKQILESKPFLYLGSISYMWYLCHQNIGYVIMNYQFGIGINKEFVPYTTLIATCILASILHFFLEVPFIKLLKLDKKKPEIRTIEKINTAST